MAEPASSGWRSLPGSTSENASRSLLGRPLIAGDVLTAAEVAALLRVPKSTVEDWARRGIVPSRKVGRRRLYIRARIEALLLDDGPGEVESKSQVVPEGGTHERKLSELRSTRIGESA
jgi:excisionase family DNA binding protein